MGKFIIGKKKKVQLDRDAFMIGHGANLDGHSSWIIQRGENEKFIVHPQQWKNGNYVFSYVDYYVDF